MKGRAGSEMRPSKHISRMSLYLLNYMWLSVPAVFSLLAKSLGSWVSSE